MGLIIFLRCLIHNIFYKIHSYLSVLKHRAREKPSLRAALGENTVKHIVIAGDYTVQPISLSPSKDAKLLNALKASDISILSHRKKHASELRKLAKFSSDSLVFGTRIVSVFLLESPLTPTEPNGPYNEILQSGWESRSIDLFLCFLIYYLSRHNDNPISANKKHQKNNKSKGNNKNNNSPQHSESQNNALDKEDTNQEQSIEVQELRGEKLMFGNVLVPELGIDYSIPWCPRSIHSGMYNDVENTHPKTVIVLTPNFTDKLTPSLEKRGDLIVYLQDRRNSLDGYMHRIGVLAQRNQQPNQQSKQPTSLTLPRLIEVPGIKRYKFPDRSFPIVAWPGILPNYSPEYQMPQLVVVFSRYKHVHNIPPIALFRSELLFLGELGHATSCSFARALVDFAHTKQRYGK